MSTLLYKIDKSSFWECFGAHEKCISHTLLSGECLKTYQKIARFLVVNNDQQFFRCRICLSLPTLMKTIIRYTSPRGTQLCEHDGFTEFVSDWCDFLVLKLSSWFRVFGLGWVMMGTTKATACKCYIYFNEKWLLFLWDELWSWSWNLKAIQIEKCLNSQTPSLTIVKKVTQKFQGREFFKNGDKRGFWTFSRLYMIFGLENDFFALKNTQRRIPYGPPPL